MSCEDVARWPPIVNLQDRDELIARHGDRRPVIMEESKEDSRISGGRPPRFSSKIN